MESSGKLNASMILYWQSDAKEDTIAHTLDERLELVRNGYNYAVRESQLIGFGSRCACHWQVLGSRSHIEDSHRLITQHDMDRRRTYGDERPGEVCAKFQIWASSLFEEGA